MWVYNPFVWLALEASAVGFGILQHAVQALEEERRRTKEPPVVILSLGEGCAPPLHLVN